MWSWEVVHRQSTEALVHTLVTSRVDYCNGLLYANPYLCKLQRVQNAAARLVFRAPKFCHTSSFLLELHWLPIKSRIDFNIKVILITFKAIHGFAPKYISDLISIKSKSNYSLRSNDELLLSPPVVKTLSTLGDRAFAAAAPKSWNQLPSELRRITFIYHFKRALKTYLFKQAFY